MNRTLRQLPYNQPLRSRAVPLAQLPPLQAPQRPAEVQSLFDYPAEQLTFYVDTLSGAVRYQRHRAAPE